MISFIFEIEFKNKLINFNDLLFIQKPVSEIHLKDENYEFFSWGDPIPNPDFKINLSKNLSSVFIVNNISGHYYYILLNKKNREIIIGNSLFSILPLYYFIDQNRIIFSDNALKLGQHLGLKKISTRFILETVLFNYTLFNNSIFEDIHLLAANSYVKISRESFKVLKHTKIQDYFLTTPAPWRKSVKEIRDIFILNCEKYLPDEPYIHALTGGFDGRTLVSTAIYFNKLFSCYCFGSDDSIDMQVASQLALKANLPFINFNLDFEYVNNNSFNSGKEFILNSSGNATFSRAHYIYSAKKLSKDFRYIVTGNFGSEVMRSANNTGVGISPNLYALFNSLDLEQGIKKVENSYEFQFLNIDSHSSEFKLLKEDISKLPCYDNSLKELSKNQQFYIFIFEEIFRKYYGAEIVNQFKYIKNRTPFLDFNFLKAILNTQLSGINSDFFEHNPIKRYKGQILYANIINKTYPLFGKIITDKSYKPNDLLNFFGIFNVAQGYLKKKLRKSLSNPDPYAVNLALQENLKYWNRFPISEEYFNNTNILGLKDEILFKIISLSYLLETID